MTEYSSETCYVCEFSDDCIKSYGNPHDGCTDKFKPKNKPMLNKPEQLLSVVGKDGDLELLINIAKFEDTEEMKSFETVGWAWRHVRIWPATLDRLYRLGYLDQKLKSSSYIGYRLNDKGRQVIYGKNRQKSEGQIEQEVLEIRLANVRRNTAKEIFNELSELQRGCDGDYYTISKTKLDNLKNKFGIK